MITFEQAQELLGDIPNDQDFLKFLDGCITNRGEEWVKEHKGLLLAEWEYLDSL